MLNNPTYMEKLYKTLTKDKLLSLFIHKWAGRGFLAWILSAILFRPTPIEFALMLIPILGYTSWMIRAELQLYKQWLQRSS